MRKDLSRFRLIVLTLLPVLVLFGFSIIRIELQTSRLQAYLFHRYGARLSWSVEKGPSSKLLFPEHGPYDTRLGYTKIDDFISKLTPAYFTVSRQSRMSEELLSWMRAGLYAIYQEKSQVGLRVEDRKGEELYSALRPEEVFGQFSEIPPVLTRSLLYIENRDLLDDRFAYKNPAVEWDRFARAIVENLFKIVAPEINAPGGSTIATQLEKYRHSPEGVTSNAGDKIRQMLSASMRSYLKSERTDETRRELLMEYVNSIPLAAIPGRGEIYGLADGLHFWYGREFNSCMEHLRGLEQAHDPGQVTPTQGILFKEALSLFVAHRRPSYYLLEQGGALEKLTNETLHLLLREGIIPAPLAEKALSHSLKRLRRAPESTDHISFVRRKASNAIRTRLLSLLDLERLYDLDQVDLSVKSTIDKKTHDKVTEVLERLTQPEFAAELGLRGHRTLARGDPAQVIYSFTLFEHTHGANLLRVQTDNLDIPFDLNEGARLDLGSTAKLRVLVNYLQVLEEIFHRWNKSSPETRVRAGAADPLSVWGFTTLNTAADLSLADFLQRGMERRYSANPHEKFFTGGGIHTFSNFDSKDDAANPTVREALQRSINLPFVRLLRDIVRYFSAHGEATRDNELLTDEQVERKYLELFADREGRVFLTRFYRDYSGVSKEEGIKKFFSKLRLNPRRLVVALSSLHSTKSGEEIRKIIKESFSEVTVEEETFRKLYEQHAPSRLSLNDRAFILGIHPLELALAREWASEKGPPSSFGELVERTFDDRIESYEWLYRSKDARAKESRIRILREEEAFKHILRAWKNLGYPFKQMVPSLASALGSSGDRPAALTELVGIILNDGLRYPEIRLDRVTFARGTPFETSLARNRRIAGARVISSEIARTVKEALTEVVEKGTAQRLKKVFLSSDSTPFIIGGKTGTGDHRFEKFSRSGALISSKVLNRTATFVFFIGDRFYGTVTAHVRGSEAAKYNFTSALAADVLKSLEPALRELLQEE